MHIAEAFGGGLLEVVRDICQGHIAAGFRVSIAHGRRPETPQEGIATQLPAEASIFEVNEWGHRAPHREVAATIKLRSLIRSISPDLIVLHSSFAGVSGAVASSGIPTIFVPHAFASQLPGPRLKQAIHRRGEKFAIRRAEVTAAVSHSEAQTAKRLGATQVVTIPNGTSLLDTPNWSDDPIPPSRPKVIAVGRLVPQRRPLEVAEILNRVSDLADVSWVGGGGSGSYAGQAAKTLRSAGVELTGWLDPADVARTLESATVYLHWTSWDGLPITVLEALAKDALVLASDIEPNREVVGTSRVFATGEDVVQAIRDTVTNMTSWRSAILEQRERARKYGSIQMKADWNELVKRTSRIATTAGSQ